jgi:glycosyltransferase involved in cell wall biosynthesis
MADIELRLDEASRRWPDDATLRDFRADPSLVRAESMALARASVIVTPHAEVARRLVALASLAVQQKLEWALPQAKSIARKNSDLPLVVFAASALARKGARELAAALQGWPCRLRVLGSASDDARLWQGIGHVEHMNWQGDWLAGADVIVLPAHVEHAPRALLRAVAAGVPVVASTACGLGALNGVREIAPGDVEALRIALRAVCAS